MNVVSLKGVKLYQNKMLDVLKKMSDNSVDSVVTDPPYGINFMGKKWDYDIPSVEEWAECLRVLKPGGHIICFASTRTSHRMAVNIEDAGFEIRDTIAWVYGSGFPKNHDVSKAIDKKLGKKRNVVGKGKGRTGKKSQPNKGSVFSDDNYQWPGEYKITEAASKEAQQWEGWGTALKPAFEPITVARKPFSQTVAENVMEYGTGAINIDGCRIPTSQSDKDMMDAKASKNPTTNYSDKEDGRVYGKYAEDKCSPANPTGRFPANFIHDGSEEVVRLFPTSKSTGGQASLGAFRNGDVYGKGKDERQKGVDPGFGDEGSCARYFYCAKANKKDKTENGEVENNHVTVKPTKLMRYLCRLITQPGGVCLDPYMGSGSTGKACILEGFRFIGIDNDKESFQTAEKRIEINLNSLT